VLPNGKSALGARSLSVLACSLALTIGCLAASTYAQSAEKQNPSEAQAQSTQLAVPSESAVCLIVYQVDRGIPSPRGLRYLFYGNGFFINHDGYLVTAAHVLSQLHGGQPYLLLHDRAGQAHFVAADVVALDAEHDTAVLRATPNPFASGYAVSFFPLAADTASPDEMVRARSDIPAKPLDAYSLDPVGEEQSAGKVLRFEFSRLAKGPAETELFLFNHEIRPGQSGSPVIADVSKGVAGIVEGEWLRDNSAVFAEINDRVTPEQPTPFAADVAPIPGAAVPIHYAIALLQRKGIAWTPASDAEGPDVRNTSSQQGASTAMPEPLSLVAAPFPAESLFGGEVLLDVQVGANGTVSDVKVLHGDGPFLEQALNAVRTWTFFPAHSDGLPTAARIAVAFQFPQPYVPPRQPTVHHYAADPPSSASASGDPAPEAITTFEPAYPAGNAEGSVMLYETIDKAGNITSVRILSGKEPLTAAATNAAKQWQFTPATQSGAATDSAVIVEFTFRQPLSTRTASTDTRCVIRMCGATACLACNTSDDPTSKKN
jgi:TonB family protein